MQVWVWDLLYCIKNQTKLAHYLFGKRPSAVFSSTIFWRNSFIMKLPKEAGLSDGLRQTRIKAGLLVASANPKLIKLGPYIQWHLESILGPSRFMSIRPFCHKLPFFAIIGSGMLNFHRFRVLFKQYTLYIYIMTSKDRHYQKNLSLWTNGSSKVLDLATKKNYFLAITGPGTPNFNR